MKWLWKIEPLDPATTPPAQMVAEFKAIERGRVVGAVAGILATIAIYGLWDRLGYEKKWVEYTMFPAIAIGGCLVYRLAYEITIRIRK